MGKKASLKINFIMNSLLTMSQFIFPLITFPYISIVIGLVIATVLSHLVEYLSLGSFFTLCVSAILFFGAYAVVLTVMKEPLVLEIERQMFDKFRRKRE